MLHLKREVSTMHVPTRSTLPARIRAKPRCHTLRFHLLTVAAYACTLAACSTDSEPTAPALEAPADAIGDVIWHQASGGSQHACAITTAGQAYCWGLNSSGELGNGEGGTGSGDSETRELTPVAVVGGLVFRNISAGALRSCGVTTVNVGYCWGNNALGSLGVGSGGDRSAPTAVAGGLRFLQIDVGAHLHGCGVTTDRRIYCWGYNSQGQLGDGTRFEIENAPVVVASSRRFRQVSAGKYHTCAVTTTDEAFCWGDNDFGQLGIGTDQRRRLSPTLVAGGHAIRQIAAGGFHTCAVTTAGQAYCWGDSRSGQIGDGQTSQRLSPRLVAGGRTFDRVTAGDWHSCGETAANRAFCWGRNGEGMLGDGTTVDRLKPTAVLGGLTFAQVAAGGFASFGVTTTGALYGWGWNPNGQLGDGTTTTRTSPVKVGVL
jgi:alpha-tubulin suppressor-like RCC1 family protein